MIKYKALKRGFSLLELAMALIIIGVIVLMIVGVYKGVQSAMVHVKWQTTMDDAYNELVNYASSRGYLPLDTEFQVSFSKRIVDDYTNGGTLEYNIISDQILDKTPIQGGMICSLKRSDLTNPNGLIFTLTENSKGNRRGNLGVRSVTLEEMQASLKCLPAQDVGIETPVTPISYAREIFSFTIYPRPGTPDANGEYKWCVEVPEMRPLKCAKEGTSSNSLVLADLISALTLRYSTDYPLEGYNPPYIKPSCNTADTSNWSSSENLRIAFSDKDIVRINIGSEVIPMKVYVQDLKGNIASKYVNIVHNSPYDTLLTGAIGSCSIYF